MKKKDETSWEKLNRLHGKGGMARKTKGDCTLHPLRGGVKVKRRREFGRPL